MMKVEEETIFDTVRRFMSAGMTLEQAIEKVEGIFGGRPLPPKVKELIEREMR